MRTRIAILFAFLFAAAAYVAAQEPQPAAAPDMQQTSVVTAPVVEPPSATATEDELEKRGDLLRLQKRLLDAVDYYEAAMKKAVAPQTAVLWNKIGIARLQMTRVGDARKAFDKAVKINKQYAEAYNNRGATWYAQKKYSRAMSDYKRAITIKDDSASFHSNMGNALFAEKKLPEAVAEFHRALQLDPDILDRRSQGGVVAQMTNSKDRAEYSFLLARMYAKLGDSDRALEQLRHAIEEGYKGYEVALKDEDFAGLRKDPRFTELMTAKPVAIPQ